MAAYSLLRRDVHKAYEKKNYNDALAILENMLASAPSQDDILAALDLRVSVYLKLNDKVSARKDAAQMVRINRTDGRGYLRLGQLERLGDDLAASIKWYEHGLKKVPASDGLHAYITSQHVKTLAMLKSQTVVSNPVDPFKKLPAEIIEMIVQFFNYRETVICLRVSKTWQNMLHTYSTLRNALDFSHVGKGKLVTFPGIKAALRRSQKAERPILVVAKNLTQPAARHLKETMERWIHYIKMQHLEVDYPSDGSDQSPNISFQSLQWQRFQLRTLVFGPDHTIVMDTVYKILQSCETLQNAAFLSVGRGSGNLDAGSWARSTSVSRPNLTSLTIQGIKGNTPCRPLIMPVEFLDRFGQLRHLTLKNTWIEPDAAPLSVAFDLSSLGSLQSFDCSKLRIDKWPKLPASLELLDCTECSADCSSPPPPCDDTFEHLRIARLARSSAGRGVLRSILRSASDQLTYLDVDLSADPASDVNWTLFLDAARGGCLKELKFLRIWYSMLSDDHVDILVEHCRKLETVELRSPNITGVFIVGLLAAPESRVKRLALRDCAKVSPDTYEWARQRSVVVERTTTEMYGGSGRRVHGLD